MKKTILVTGGAGYIGSITIKELIENGYKVIVLDSLENGHREAIDPSATLEIVNLKDKPGIDQIFKKYEIDAIIDFAAYLAVGESMDQPEKYLENNVFNFINLLEAAKNNNCKLIIKSSTASTYGNPLNEDDFPLKENYTEKVRFESSRLFPGKWDDKNLEGEDFFQYIISAYQKKVSPEMKLDEEEIGILRTPTSVYGLTKLLDEIVMKKYDKLSDLKGIALRYFNVAGADQGGEIGEDKPNPTNLMTVTVLSLIGKRPKLQIYGNDYETRDGTGIRDYIHVSDLAKGHVKALKYLLENQKSDTFNLGNGIGYTVLEVIAAVEKASKLKVDYEIVPRRSGDPAISTADPTKAKTVLDWEAKYSLNDMADTAWKWHSSHPDGYLKK